MVVIVTNAPCTDADDADAQVSMATSALEGQDVARVTVAVSCSGLSRTSRDLNLVGSTWQGTIGPLPVGTERTFIGSAFDANDVLLFEGMASGFTSDNTAVILVILQHAKQLLPDRQCGAGDQCDVCQH